MGVFEVRGVPSWKRNHTIWGLYSGHSIFGNLHVFDVDQGFGFRVDGLHGLLGLALFCPKASAPGARWALPQTTTRSSEPQQGDAPPLLLLCGRSCGGTWRILKHCLMRPRILSEDAILPLQEVRWRAFLCQPAILYHQETVRLR